MHAMCVPEPDWRYLTTLNEIWLGYSIVIIRQNTAKEKIAATTA